jgi:hypothetical protein
MGRCRTLIVVLASAHLFSPPAYLPAARDRARATPASRQAPFAPVCRDAASGETRAGGRAYDELTAEQRRVFDGGEQVFVRRDIAGSPWPAVIVYQYIDASPEAAAAVFIDYESHRRYIPGVRQSRVSAVVDPATVEVDYVLSVPLVSDERYTVRNHLCSYGGGDSYAVEWTLVRASSTKATTGQARFEPHLDLQRNEHGTVMVYSNFVTPGSRVAGFGMIKSRALQQMRETAAAIVRRVEVQRSTDRPLLEKQIDALRAALKR